MSLRLSSNILKLVLHDLAEQISDNRPLSTEGLIQMQRFAGDLHLLVATATGTDKTALQQPSDALEILQEAKAKAVEDQVNKDSCNGHRGGWSSEEDGASTTAPAVVQVEVNGADAKAGMVQVTSNAEVVDVVPKPDMSSPRELTETQKALVTIFTEMDGDGSGSLTTEELRKALIVIGVPAARLVKLIKLADKDDSGEIEMQEWIAAVSHPDMAEMHSVMEKMVTRTTITGGALYGAPTNEPRCLAYPNQKPRIAWDLCLGFLCFYIAAMLPFTSAFGDGLDKSTVNALDNIDRFINYFFLLDIVLNFRTAYVTEDGKMIADSKMIALRYLRTWFLLDFLSSFPFEDVSSGQMPNLQTAKLLKMSKLARVFRFLRSASKDLVVAADISDGLDDFMQKKWVQQLLRRGSIFIKAALLCHWLACGLKSVDAPEGLLSGYVVNASVSREYLAALYWSMTTLTTVGYGDMIPTSDKERAYTTVAMVIGGGFYGYIVGIITSMVSTEDLNVTAFHDRMDLIRAWLDHHKIPMYKRRIVRRYFQAYLKEKSAVSESEIWNDLSPELQKQVGGYIVHENVLANPLFDGMPQGIIVRMQSILRRVTMSSGHDITHAGEGGTAMYIIIVGSVEKETETGAKQILGAGECFGEEILLGISEQYDYTVRAVDKATMEMLLEDEFLNLFQAMPHVLEKMRINAFELHPDWKERV